MLKISAVPASNEPVAATGQGRFSCLRADAGGVVRLGVAGELDVATAPQLETALRDAETDAGLVVLDLRRLTFMDCSSMHVMLAAHRRARLAGGRLVVVRGQVDVARLFALVGVDDELELVDQPPAWPAVPALAGPP